jgi:hypothetical protein
MAKTAAQRQADYRSRRATAGDNGERRINTWVSTRAALALARLAQHHGLSRRELLERLVLAADEGIASGLDPDSAERATYFEVVQ